MCLGSVLGRTYDAHATGGARGPTDLASAPGIARSTPLMGYGDADALGRLRRRWVRSTRRTLRRPGRARALRARLVAWLARHRTHAPGSPSWPKGTSKAYRYRCIDITGRPVLPLIARERKSISHRRRYLPAPHTRIALALALAFNSFAHSCKCTATTRRGGEEERVHGAAVYGTSLPAPQMQPSLL